MKQNVSIKQIKTYCEVYNIDFEKVFKNPEEEHNKKQIVQIFEAFTDISYSEEGVAISVISPSGTEQTVNADLDDIPPFWQSTSIDELHGYINSYVDLYNKSFSRVSNLYHSLESLDTEEKEVFLHIMKKSDQALLEINQIVKKKPLTTDDLVEENRLEYLQARLDVLKDLEGPNLEVTVAPMKKDGTFGERRTVVLDNIPQAEQEPITFSNVKEYLEKHHSINHEDLFKEGSFLRQTKEGFTALNETLKHFTEHSMNTGVGMEYSFPDEEHRKVVYQRITSFDEITDLNNLVWHMNRIQRQKARNIALIKELEKQEENEKNKGRDER